MKKVLFITNIPSPYRIDFWNELGKFVNLTVWFEATNEKNREWNVNGLGENFKYEFLEGRTFGLDLHINYNIIKKLNNEKFDVYIMGGYSTPTEMIAIQWFRMNRIKFILNSDGGFIKDDKKITKMIKKYFISSADKWLSSGSNCTKYLMHYGANENYIYEYPFSSVSYPLEELSVIDKNEKDIIKLKENLNKIVLLCVSRFDEMKGIDVLIKSFQKINNNEITLLIIGGGPMKSKYMDYIKSNNISNIVIKDFIQKEELIKFYKISDIFILPTKYDVWGLVVNEAMNFGLPIITTEMCGCSYDLINNGENGYIIKSEDQEELTSKMEILIKDEIKRKEFGKKSLQIIESYNIKNMVTKHLDLIL